MVEVTGERKLVRLRDLDTRGMSLQLPGGMEMVVTPDDVLEFLVRDGEVTRVEAVLFLAFCASRGLNPLEDDAYVVKYDKDEPARIVLGKHGWLKLAERHPQYAGHTSGIIVRTKDGRVELKPGAFYEKEREALVGGWAEVYRKDKPPYPKKVLLEEFNTGRKMWRTMPAVMIEKVAVVQGLREALPDLGLAVVIPEEELPEEDEQARERKAFWATARKLGYSHEQVHQALGVASVNDWLADGKTYAQALEVLRAQKLPAEAKVTPEGKRFKAFGDVAKWAYENFKVGPMKIFADFNTSGWEDFDNPDRAAELIENRYGKKP